VQDLSPDQADDLRERIETAIGKLSLRVPPDKHARVGVSVGAARYGVDGETLTHLLIAADQAMYSVKSNHKQRHRHSHHGNDKGSPAIVETLTSELASTAIN